MLTQECALTLPEKPRALVLVNTVRNYGALVAGNRRRRALRSESEETGLASLMGRCLRGEASPEEILAYRRQTGPLSLHNQAVLEDLLALQAVNFPVRLQVQTDLTGFDVRHRLGSLTSPVLITGSPHDLTCADEPRHIHQELPQSILVNFLESAHLPFMEEQEHFVDVLREWLKKTVLTEDETAP
jgi:pimeloyl-ACP methyl ester carboxylesterase